jgi:hypothetical protein
MRALGVLVSSAALIACASSTSGGGAPMSSGDPPDTADRDQVERGGTALATLESVIVGADSAFAFDPTIDPAATAAQNSSNIQTHARLAPCARVSTTADGVSIDDGAGCLVGAETLTGGITVGVRKDGATTTLTLTTTSFSANGKMASGTASFATSDGSNFDVTVDLTGATATRVSGKVAVEGRSGTFVIDGTVTAESASVTATVSIDAVTYMRGQCYASTGTVTVASALTTTTYAFEPLTPVNGQVAVTKSGVPKDSIELPPYGKCGVP